MSALAELHHDIAGIGDNSQNMSPFDLSESEINDLYAEATHWLDGAAVTTQTHVDAIQKLMRQLQAAAKLADERRAEEAKPFDDGKKAVQAKYAPLISDTKGIRGKTVLAIEACKKAMQPFLVAKEAEQQEAARAARAEADRRQAEAEAAFRASQVDDLAARERAEMIKRDADRLASDAADAEKARPTAKGGEGRAASLRTTYEPEITDMQAFARWCWAERRPELNEFFTGQAKHLVFIGKRDIPGVTVHEGKAVV